MNKQQAIEFLQRLIRDQNMPSHTSLEDFQIIINLLLEDPSASMVNAVIRREYQSEGWQRDTIIALFESYDDAQGYTDQLNFTSKQEGVTEFVLKQLNNPEGTEYK